MLIAKLTVSGVTAQAEILHRIPAGLTGGTVELHFPDPEWSGIVKNVKFRANGLPEIPPILGASGTVTIPAALTAEPNTRIEIGVVGVTDGNGQQITPTLWADLGIVRPSAGYIPEDEATPPPAAPPETWTQLLAMIGDLSGLPTEAKASIVASIRELGGDLNQLREVTGQNAEQLLQILQQLTANVGQLETLQTENKDSLVAAINEIVAAMGDNSEIEAILEGIAQTLEPLIIQVDDLARDNTAQAEALAQINRDISDLKKFHPIEVKSVSNNVGTRELGQSVASVVVSWVFNKSPVSQTVDGKVVETSVRSAEIHGPFTSGRSFAVVATDAEGNTASGSTSIAFYNGVYYGVVPAEGEITREDILAMNRKLQSGVGVTFTATAKAGEKFAYAQPANRRAPKINVGGFDYVWEEIGPFDFENGSGYTEPYKLWRAKQEVVGTRTIVIS